jgi:dTDP-4-dehydrorhamnose 3,5-epimerase-like enzyme
MGHHNRRKYVHGKWIYQVGHTVWCRFPTRPFDWVRDARPDSPTYGFWCRTVDYKRASNSGRRVPWNYMPHWDGP